MQRKTIVVLLLFVVALCIPVITTVWQISQISPSLVETTLKDSPVRFEADRGWVMFRTGCVNASWAVENVRAVFVDNRPNVGMAEDPICVQPAQMPWLQIIHQDGTASNVYLDITLITETRTFWSGMIAGILVALIGLLQFEAMRTRAMGVLNFHNIALVVIVLIGLALRLRYLNGDVFIDESDTYIKFISRHVGFIRSDLSEPNNHILYNLLVHWLIDWWGLAPWTLRFPAFVSGVILIPVTYWATRVTFNKDAALIAAGFVAVDSALIALSVNGRGYTMLAVFLVILIGLTVSLRRGGSWWQWVIYGLVAIAGFYTNRIFLIGMAVAAAWLLVQIVMSNHGTQRIKALVRYVITLTASAVLTVVLYWPVIENTGVEKLLDSKWVSTAPMAIHYMFTIPFYLAPIFFVVVLHIGVILAVVFYRRSGFQLISLAILTLLMMLMMPLVFEDRAHIRFWAYLTPVYFIISAVGLATFARSRWNTALVGICVGILAIYITATYDKQNINLEVNDPIGISRSARYIKAITDEYPNQRIILILFEGSKSSFEYYMQYLRIRPEPVQFNQLTHISFADIFDEWARSSPDEQRMFIFDRKLETSDFVADYLDENSVEPAFIPPDMNIQIIESYPTGASFAEVMR